MLSAGDVRARRSVAVLVAVDRAQSTSLQSVMRRLFQYTYRSVLKLERSMRTIIIRCSQSIDRSYELEERIFSRRGSYICNSCVIHQFLTNTWLRMRIASYIIERICYKIAQFLSVCRNVLPFFIRKLIEQAMSWSDILYPGNPERRADVVRKIQQLADQMQENFRATNKLAKYLNENCKQHIPTILYDTQKTMKQNADQLIDQVKKIQAVVKSIKEMLKKKLDPDLYKKLFDVNTSLDEKLKMGENISHVMAGILGITVTGVVGKLLAEGVFEAIENSIVRIGASAVLGAIAGGVAGLAVDVIAGAIAGAYERDDLEKAIKELEEEIKQFIPASQTYTDSVLQVLAYIQMWEEQHPPK